MIRGVIMSAMATLLTRADRDALPDDGRRQELLDGAFFVTPAPGYDHQDVVMRLGVRLFQAVTKRDLYEKAGVLSYWLVDPAGPSITVLELVDGNYQEVARAQDSLSRTTTTGHGA